MSTSLDIVATLWVSHIYSDQLSGGLYHASVDLLVVMEFHRSDLSFLSQHLASSAGKGGVDLQTLDKARGGDELHLGHLSLKSVPAVLVEENLGVQLFSELSLVPLLLDDTTAQRQTKRRQLSNRSDIERSRQTNTNLLLLTGTGQSGGELLLLSLLLDFRSLSNNKDKDNVNSCWGRRELR